MQSKLSDRFKRFDNLVRERNRNKISVSEGADYKPEGLDNSNQSEYNFFEENQEVIDFEEETQIMPDIDLENIDTDYKKALLQKIESIPVWFEYSSEKQKELISNFVNNRLNAECRELSEGETIELINRLYTSVLGFGPIDYLINQENVSNIFINGEESIHIEIAGKILDTETKLNDKQLNFILKSIYNLSEIKPNENSLIWNCKIKNLLISVILPPISENGGNILIKKVSTEDMDLSKLFSNGFFNHEIFEFLSSAINSKKNIIIAGDINSGKTLLLDTLLYTSMMKKRGVLIEEFPQLLSSDPNMMKYSLASLKSNYEFSVLLSTVLRMAPEYLVLDFNNANYLNSSISTFSDLSNIIITTRASSFEAVISKFISAYMSEEKLNEKQAKMKLLSTFDYVIQINKGEDGVKRITSIVELIPSKLSTQCFNEIVRWENNKFITNLAQSELTVNQEINPSKTSIASRFA